VTAASPLQAPCAESDVFPRAGRGIRIIEPAFRNIAIAVARLAR
jgi:hypothetical protein